MNMNSLNGGAAPAAPAPKGGPPIAVIVIVILVIIGIVVGIVMATRPAPKAAALPATIPPPPAAVMPPPPPPATVPTGSSPASSMGREMAVSAVIRTPDEMLTAKQAQADMRYAEPKLTNEQLAQAQRDAGKKVEVIKDPRLQENINTMKNVAVVTPGQMGGKIAELKGPQQAQESMKMGGKIAEVKGVQEGVKMGGTGITQMGKIAELKGPQQAQESMKMGGKIADVKAPPPAAYNVKQNAIAYLADPARTSKMIGTAGGSLDVCKASCDGKPECTHFDRVGNSCTLYKGAEWVGSYPGGQSYCKSQCQT